MAHRQQRDVTYFRASRSFVLRRDGGRCVLCGSSERVKVHHIRPLRLYRTMRQADRPRNLIVLCETHHALVHAWSHRIAYRWLAWWTALLTWLVTVPIFWLARRQPYAAVRILELVAQEETR